MSRRSAALALEARERPFAARHDASVERAARRAAEPRTLDGYLLWFATGWRAEVPADIHTRGPFFGGPDRPGAPEATSLAAKLSAPETLVGGSRLGSPRLAEPFRRLMENSPWETEHAEYDGHQSHDVHYVRPMHAAVASLAHRQPMTARTLAAIAYADFDWVHVALRRAWDVEMFALFLEKAMHMLWVGYAEAPTRTRIG